VDHFDITDPLPSGTVLLEASAGTGKTWTIAALVARFVAEGRADLRDMLVVTFSRAASQELRARVREQLVLVERCLRERTCPPGDALLSHLLTGDEQILGQRHRRVRAALTDFDAATIATVHQFCQEVLRSLGVAGTADASATLVEDLDDLLMEVVDDLYLRGFRNDRQAIFSRSEALDIARTAVDDIHADLRPESAEPGTVPARRAGFARAVRTEFDLRKRRRQVLHYNDLLTQLADALEDPVSLARDRMRQRWQVVLVDEFQDTDPVQWQVLDRAFTGHCTAMVLIGDPKQAIYGFRGGDIATYLTAAEAATVRKTLPRNYRSDAGVVRALDTLLQGAQLGDPQIVVRPIEAAAAVQRLHGAPSDAPVRLRQVLLEDHLGGSDRIGATRDHLFPDLARDVAGLLMSGATFDGRPLQASDVAVLAHKGRDLIQAQDALRALGVHAVSAGGMSVLQTIAAHEWLTLLEAMVAPHRSVLTRAAALTDLLGHDPIAVDEGGSDLDDVLAQTVRDLAAVYARQGMAAVLERLVAAGLTARVLGRLGGERTLTDVEHVAELLHDVVRYGQLGLVALLEWLRAQMAEDGPTSTNARTRRLDSDAAAVQLLTVHGSKGLQFPVVYLPALTDRNVPDAPTIPLCHDDPPERTRSIDVGGRTGPQWRDSVTRHKAEEAGESLRLLYVALTRAQSQVVTWWSPTGRNTGPSALHRVLFGRAQGEGPVPDTVPVPAEDFASTRLQEWAGLGAFRLERADHAALVPVVPPGTAPAPRSGTWTRRIDTDWRRTSYTALSTPRDAQGHELTGGVGSEPERSPREDEPDNVDPVVEQTPLLPGLEVALPGQDVPSPMAVLPVGATFGSLVHGVLEHADPQARDLRAELLEQIREQLVQWPVDLDPEDLADALVAVSDSPLGPLAQGMTLRQIGRADRLCELDFELPLGGGDLRRDAMGQGARLGDLVPLLRRHLPAGDPVRAWADVLDSSPELADQSLRGYLTGSIDVVLRAGGRYLVLDYKTNWLGRPEETLTAADYRPEKLAEAMGHSSYPLQALLYAVVAHRFLRWRLPGYRPSRHLGGVIYLYVRGMCGPQTPLVQGHPCGVFSWKPPVDLVTGVSDLLDGRTGEGAA
jgi:exodeoxyribonuclease V beta subunit